MQTIRHPVPVQTEVVVNGAAFDLGGYAAATPVLGLSETVMGQTAERLRTLHWPP